MATEKFQRIGIWVIVIVLTVGTIGSFAAVILSTVNSKTDTELQSVALKEYQAKVAEQTAALSAKYFDELNGYSSRVGAFDKDSVTELKTEDLKVGDGTEITADSSFTAYYIGWNPTGKIFDSSISGTSLKAPLPVSPGGVISGWTEGVVGMKVGGIRELTIPSDKAYGETGSGADIPANTPIKFVVMIIPTPDAVEIPAILKQTAS